MDSQSQAQLERILALDPSALTEGDKLFLEARRSYLTPEQEALYFGSAPEKKPKKQ